MQSVKAAVDKEIQQTTTTITSVPMSNGVEVAQTIDTQPSRFRVRDSISYSVFQLAYSYDEDC